MTDAERLEALGTQSTLRLGEIMLLARRRPDYRAIFDDWHDRCPEPERTLWESRFKSLKSAAESREMPPCKVVVGRGARAWSVSRDTFAAYVKALDKIDFYAWLRDFSKEWSSAPKALTKKKPPGRPTQYHKHLVRYLALLKDRDPPLFKRLMNDEIVREPLMYDIKDGFEAYARASGLEGREAVMPPFKEGAGVNGNTRAAIKRALDEIDGS